MATTTPNYGWTVPTSTDLVKDGATAIETLGDAIDASMNTALGTKKAGMVLLNTTSFSGVASQSINDVFSATYNHYLIVIDDLVRNTGAALDIYLRLRVSGTDSTTGYYWGQGYSLFAASSSGSGSLNNGNHFTAAGCSSTQRGFSQIWLQNPFLAKQTGYQALQTRQDAGSYIAGYNSATTSYTGFSIVADSNNLSGSVSTYGFNK